jgi:hypothetical protein
VRSSLIAAPFYFAATLSAAKSPNTTTAFHGLTFHNSRLVVNLR